MDGTVLQIRFVPVTGKQNIGKLIDGAASFSKKQAAYVTVLEIWFSLNSADGHGRRPYHKLHSVSRHDGIDKVDVVLVNRQADRALLWAR